jgi:hypothetical protein
MGQFFIPVSAQDSQLSKWKDKIEIPYLKGESNLMIEAKPSPDFDDNKWFTNDHCIIERDGVLHWFGINNPYSPEGKEYITSCGSEDQHYLNSHGVTVAELGWLKP